MKVTRATLVAAALVAVLVGCEDTSVPVSGNRADISYRPKETETSWKKVYDEVCTKKEKGVCKKYKNVYKGKKEKVVRTIVDERFCVRLNNVNGKTSADNRWYTVTSDVYLRAAGKVEGEKIKFTPIHDGCW